MMDVFAVMAQINEQLGAAPDLETFLDVVVGVIKDLTQFHRVLVYQFDESWNGKVMAELVDWTQTHDLYKGLHFPAVDIPAQARNLYALSKCSISSRFYQLFTGLRLLFYHQTRYDYSTTEGNLQPGCW